MKYSGIKVIIIMARRKLLAYCIFKPHPPYGARILEFPDPPSKIQQKKKEFPREGLNFKENLWKFHGVG
jgi:hypothetical protein